MLKLSSRLPIITSVIKIRRSGAYALSALYPLLILEGKIRTGLKSLALHPYVFYIFSYLDAYDYDYNLIIKIVSKLVDDLTVTPL